MRCARALLVPLALLLAVPAAAFEGVLHLDVIVDGQKSRGRVLLRETGGLRADFMFPVGGRRVNTSLIVLGSQRDLLVHAVHDTSTFERRALPPAGTSDERFVVERAGEAEVAGRKAARFRVVDTKSGDRLEVWVDPSLSGGDTLSRVWSSLRPGAGDVGAALRAAGGGGMPLRVSWDRRHGGRVYVTVVEVSVEPVPREALDLPPGYREAPLGALLHGGSRGAPLPGLDGLFGR